MRKCPECNRVYSDETLNYCLEDGAALITPVEPDTAVLPRSIPASEAATRTQRSGETAESARPVGNAALAGFPTRRWIICSSGRGCVCGFWLFHLQVFCSRGHRSPGD